MPTSVGIAPQITFRLRSPINAGMRFIKTKNRITDGERLKLLKIHCSTMQITRCCYRELVIKVHCPTI